MFNYMFPSLTEYNVMQPPPLNEKVLKDKRKKLKETLDRVLKMYVSIYTFYILGNDLVKAETNVIYVRRTIDSLTK